MTFVSAIEFDCYQRFRGNCERHTESRNEGKSKARAFPKRKSIFTVFLSGTFQCRPTDDEQKLKRSEPSLLSYGRQESIDKMNGKCRIVRYGVAAYHLWRK